MFDFTFNDFLSEHTYLKKIGIILVIKESYQGVIKLVIKESYT